MKRTPLSLPREVSPVRVRSQYRRSLLLARSAVKADNAPSANVGTATRKRDRVLGALAVRAKVRLVTFRATGTKGRKAYATLRRLARDYRVRLARWQGYHGIGHDIGVARWKASRAILDD